MAITVQLVGAVLLLSAFALAQRGKWTTTTPPYLITNLVGAAALASSAFVNEQWGFVMLNTVWSLVAVVGLVGLARSRRPAPNVDDGH